MVIWDMVVVECDPYIRFSMALSISLGTIHEDADLLSRLINQVYAVAEAGMWQETDGVPIPRTTVAEVKSLLAKQHLLIARNDQSVVGCVCLQRLSSQVAEFGLLVAHPDFRGQGIGRALVCEAEERARKSGAGLMQLELLTPKDWEHPVKAFLHRWYTRIGYIPIRTEPFAETYGHLAPYLATECNFTVYHKTL